MHWIQYRSGLRLVTTMSKTRVLAAECPMSWCTHTEVATNPDNEWAAAEAIADHVNEDHSEMDIETLKNEDISDLL